MFAATTSFHRPGERLGFVIHLPDSDAPIEGSAEVVRVQGGDESDRPAGLGIRFLDLPPDQEERIRTIVNALLASDRGRAD